jgi:hypothetical protein
LCAAVAAWFAAAKAFDILTLQLCPADGLAGMICDKSITTNLMWASTADRILFGLLAVAVYFVARLWLAPWIERRWPRGRSRQDVIR